MADLSWLWDWFPAMVGIGGGGSAGLLARARAEGHREAKMDSLIQTVEGLTVMIKSDREAIAQDLKDLKRMGHENREDIRTIITVQAIKEGKGLDAVVPRRE